MDYVLLLALLGQLRGASALNNGIGLKPHMGWSSWVRYTGAVIMVVPHKADDLCCRTLHSATRRLPNTH